MTPGKSFEKDWKDSIPCDVYFYRLRDGTANWSGEKNENTRFQQTNDYDCFMFKYPNFFALELKSYNGTSFPLSSIRKNQIKGLRYAFKFTYIKSGIVFNIRKIEQTYFISWSDIEYFMQTETRKSIPNQWIIDNGIQIVQHKKKVHYSYNIRGFISYFDKF